MKHILSIMLIAAALGGGGLACADSLDNLQGLRASETVLPLFNGRELQCLIFGKSLVRDNAWVAATGPIIDLVVRNVNIDTVKTDRFDLGPYPFGKPALKWLYEFWKGRPWSEGLIFSSTGRINQQTRTAFGEDKVYFRSPSLDIDGVGFEADLNLRTVWVKHKVKILLRTGKADVRKALMDKTQPAGDEHIAATSDELRMDFRRNEIVLIGKVEVDEKENRLFCDRMVLYLDSVPAAEGNNSSTPVMFSSGKGGSGISRIVCTGNVKVQPKKEADNAPKPTEHEQKLRKLNRLYYGNSPRPVVFCSQVKPKEQTKPKGQAKPSSTGLPPSTILADRSEFDFKHNRLTFTGNVDVDDAQLKLRCRRIVVFFAGKDQKGRKNGGALLGGGSGTQLERIVCTGKVRAKNQGNALESEDLILTFRPQAKPGPGMFGFSGVELTKIHSTTPMKIIRKGRLDDKGKPMKDNTLAAKKGELNFLTGVGFFDGNVQVRDTEYNLDSEKLWFYTTPDAKKEAVRSYAKSKKEDVAPERIPFGDNRELTKLVAREKVLITRITPNGEHQTAEGEEAVYEVAKRLITLYGTNLHPPKLTAAMGIMQGKAGSRVELHLDDERAEVIDGAMFQVNRQAEEPKR
ncbi:MAG: LptA/OstA family protein [Victivallaceae bacterium]|nr:LptA/OstA family protein [Victivallaceae bacterium]